MSENSSDTPGPTKRDKSGNLKYPKEKPSLNPRQMLFCKKYALHKNANQAAREAGYLGKNSRIGYRLLENPVVQFHIKQYEMENVEACTKEADALVNPKLKGPYDAAKAMEELDVAYDMSIAQENVQGVSRCVELKMKLNGLLNEVIQERPGFTVQILNVAAPQPRVEVDDGGDIGNSSGAV